MNPSTQDLLPMRNRSVPSVLTFGPRAIDFRCLLNISGHASPMIGRLCSAVVSNLALQRSLPLLSGGLPGGIRPVRSFDESAVFSDRPTEVPGGLVTRLNFQRVRIVPL